MIEAYRTDNTDYTKNGDMPLLPIDAKVNVELNGTWALELEHPIDDEGRWKYLEEEAVVKCPSFNGDQLFRIKPIEKNDDSVLAKAYPIFFDSKNDCFLTDVRPTGKNGQEALNIMLAPNKKYSAQSDIHRRATAYYEYMNLMEAINGDNANSFLNRWGGEILYDNFTIIVNERVGGDYGVELRYGKNIPANGITETVDMSEVVTRIYPKAYNGYKLSGNGYVDSPILSNYPTVKAATMKFDNIKMREDAQEDDEEKGVVICDTQADLDRALTEACKKQFEAGLDKPKVTIEADMVLLQNTDQYKDYEILETVSLGDTIHCLHNKLGIETDARVIELEYDCLTERVTSVVLGDFKQNYLDKVAGTVDKIESVITPDGGLMADKVIGILDAMKTQLKYQKDIAKKQDVRAILFEDLDPESLTYGAMCLGTQGFQLSNRRTADGRDWDWNTAGTANGLNADIMVTGTLTDKTGKNYWNLDTGDFQLTGIEVEQKDWQDEIDQAQQNAITAAEKALSDYANTVSNDLDTLQKQVDGQVEDWYYDYVPTAFNEPASAWTTEEEKKKHEGDRFFWKSRGYAYRWMKNGTAWEWVLLKDTDITKAMKEAQDAKDLADGKRRTFVTQPVPPYDVGDLWMDGTDVLTCMTERAEGSYFNKADWRKLNKYTDDSFVDGIKNDLQNQIDGKVQTYSQNYDPSSDWRTENDRTKHTGDIWYNTDTKETRRWTGTDWEVLLNKDAEEAVNLAKKKAQVFVAQPFPPYFVGDLWFDGKDILTCRTAKVAGSFSASDWEKKQGYTDDTTANEALDASKNPNQHLTQEQVFNKLTNDGALQGIFMRDGVLYLNGEYIKSKSINSEKLDVQTLSAITANLGKVNSADINNFLNGVKVLEIKENLMTFFDKYESRTIGGVGPIQEVRDEYGVELWSTLFSQLVSGITFLRVRPSGMNLHATNITINEKNDLTKYANMNVLWSGELIMNASEQAVLTESILSQPHGIILVFSAFDTVNNKPGDWWWNTQFIPKKFVEQHPWVKYCFNLSGGADAVGFGRKMLAFYDTKVIGDNANQGAYTAGGVRYENNRFVLRCIYGV